MGDPNRGLYQKFTRIERADGQHEPGRKHADCEYFVLDLDHDPHAYAALLAYARSCESEYPLLARDLRTRAALMTIGQSAFFDKSTPKLVTESKQQQVDAWVKR